MHPSSVTYVLLGLIQAVHSSALPEAARSISATNSNEHNFVEKRAGTVECFAQDPFPQEWHAEIDEATDMLRSYGELGELRLFSNGEMDYWNLRGMEERMYYFWCQTGPREGDGNISFDDIQEATFAMDQSCGAYQPAIFRWSGSDEVFGRSRPSGDLCTWRRN